MSHAIAPKYNVENIFDKRENLQTNGFICMCKERDGSYGNEGEERGQ